MTVSLPIPLSMQSSNVTDPAVTLDELMMGCQAPIFSDGFEIRESDWVFEYRGDISTPRIWSQTDADAGEYYIDQVLIRDCKLVKVTGKDGTGITINQRAYEPEEYGTYETDMDSSNWTERYVRMSNVTACGWLQKTWYSPSNKRYYYLYWETSQCNVNSACGDGGWLWSAKDLNALDCDTNAIWYLRSCMKDNYSNKFDFSKDIKASIVNWGSTGYPTEDTVQFNSLIERGEYFYLRTHINYPVEYYEWETGTAFSYSYMDVVTPADIEGFTQKRRINAQNPFDGKNYTKAIVDTMKTGYMATWTCLAAEPFDTIAFGRVLCDSIDVVFKNIKGDVLGGLNNYKIDNTVSKGSKIEFPATVVLYTDTLYDAETVIEITLHGSHVSVGEILGGEKIDAGFTKLDFKNKFKDFSPTEEDQWGNYYYIDGLRVSEHSGSVEFPILRYDQLNRLMLLIGGRKVIINSSDSTRNELSDGRKVFEATMMIARFTSLALDTSEKNKRIGEQGKYAFTVRELVSFMGFAIIATNDLMSPVVNVL